MSSTYNASKKTDLEIAQAKICETRSLRMNVAWVAGAINARCARKARSIGRVPRKITQTDTVAHASTIHVSVYDTYAKTVVTVSFEMSFKGDGALSSKKRVV